MYVDSAPHSVANSGLTVTDWHGFNGSLRYRHVSKYVLDGSDPTVPKATGLDVLDLSTSKRTRHGLDLNFGTDNVNNERFYETQNYLESRVTPTADPKFRVHGTPSDRIYRGPYPPAV